MKLLIITQVIDTEHPILGFFHRWVEEFAKHCEHVHVIALQVGRHSLPTTVTVHSLGKEAGKGRFTYLYRFFKLIISLRYEYDNVFIHMNQIYVILGGLFWRLMGKQIGLWYAHGTVTHSLKVATTVAHTIFTSTPEGFRIKTSKVAVVGQGIDTDLFKPANTIRNSDTLSLITVGRIAPSKNLATLLHACANLKASGIPFSFRIIGVATIPTEVAYEQTMRELVTELGLAEEVIWQGAVAQRELPQYLQSATHFIHDGSTNSLDKALLEAALCGSTVISSNPAYKVLAQPFTPTLVYPPHDAVALTECIQNSLTEAPVGVSELQSQLADTYSIQSLVSGIVGRYY